MEADHPERHGFTLRYADGMAVLIVAPGFDSSRSVYADDVTARMKILGIPSVPAKRIREVLDAASGKPEPLVEWPAGAALNATVSVDVSEDCMEALISVIPARPGGAPVNRKMVADALAAAGVIRGLDRESLKILMIGGAVDRPLTVARGSEPIAGKPARIECLFITERGKPWKDAGSGRIDLKELNFIQNRSAGDLVARNIDAVPPRDGFDVLGRVLKADPVKEALLLRAGIGVRETEEGMEAEIDGNVRLEGGEICVEPSVTVRNVDYSTGNIDFDGSVCVEGTIADGFMVKARGDIQVGKTAGRVRLESGRNLVLVAGLVGDGEGRCLVKGNLYAKFLEGAVTHVSGDMVVTEAVLHSETEVEGSLFLTEGRGEITGGIAVVGGGVDCKRIGNIYAGETRIYAGCPPDELKHFNNLGMELKALRDETDDLDRQIDYLKSRTGTDPREIRDRERAKGIRIGRLREGAARLKEMRSILTAPDGTAIVARDRIYTGAGLFFGLEEYPLGEKGLERAVLRRERGRTVMHGYIGERAGEI